MITFAEPTECKNSRVLKVSGTTARTGVFTSGEGLKAPFTPELVERIFSNTSPPVPSYLTHENRDNRGYIYKMKYDRNADTISYEGFVFDKDASQKIENEGFDKVSPEIEFEMLNGTPVSGRITGVAFVRNPAISGTQVTTQAVAFSKPIEEKNMVTGITTNFAMSTTTDGGYVFTPHTDVASGVISTGTTTTYPMVFNQGGVTKEDVEAIKATFESKIAELEKKLAKYEDAAVKDGSPAPVAVPPVSPTTTVSAVGQPAPVVESPQVNYKQKYDAVIAERANAVVSELRELGLKEPELIGKGLDTEARLSVLSAVKENMAKTTPMTKAATEVITPVAAGVSREDKIKALMRDNGINESYLKYVKVN